MKRFLCRIFGCDLRYNHPSLPNKCICARCKRRYFLDLKTLIWYPIISFGWNFGTDEELINRWIKFKNYY